VSECYNVEDAIQSQIVRMFYKADLEPKAVMPIAALMSIDVSNSFNSLGTHLQSRAAPPEQGK